MKPRPHHLFLFVALATVSACGGDESTADTSTDESGDLAAWCLAANAGPISDNEGTEQAMRAILTREREQHAVAPAAIKAAADISLASTELFVSIMEQNGFDDSLFTPEQLDSLDPTPEDQAAFDELEQFRRDSCS